MRVEPLMDWTSSKPVPGSRSSFLRGSRTLTRELALHRLAVVARDLERLDHQLGLVVPDGAGGQLDAVADDVV
ncbi:hypothetical protein MHW47_35090, partial [Streptomyces sp. OfavH-34-F]